MTPEERAIGESLDHFERALAEGRRVAAYEALLASWRSCRAPELAALLDRAAALFGAAPPGDKSLKGFQAAWLEAARSRRPFDARALLEALEPLATDRKGSNMAACLDELRMVEGDPTLALVACRLAGLPGGNVNFGAWGKVLTRLFAIIENAGDPRAIEPLETLLAVSSLDPKEAYAASKRSPSTNEALAKRTPRTLEVLRRHVPTPLSDELRDRALSLLARFEEPLPAAVSESTAATSQDDLLTQVLANPDDDALRAVWADALQQAGDPRGELIALQLRGPEDKTAARAAEKLVTKHWKAWLGPLAPAVVRSSLVFDRGLLDECVTDVRRKATATAVFSHPSWGTVRSLEFKQFGVLSPAMTRVEVVTGVPEGGLESLATCSFARLRSLDVTTNPSSDYDDGLKGGRAVSRGMKALSTSKGLPSLSTLTLRLLTREFNGTFVERTADHYRCIFEAPFAAQLTTFGVRADWSPGPWSRALDPTWLLAWVEAVPRYLPGVRSLKFVHAASLIVEVATGEATVLLDAEAGADGAELSPRARERIETARSLVQRAGLTWKGP